MSISNLLNIGRHSLGAYQSALEQTGQNASNVGTRGYSRRRGTLNSITGGGQGIPSGVAYSDPRRIVDRLGNASVRRARSNVGRHAARQPSLQRIQAVVAPEGAGLNSRLDALFNSFHRLSTQPAGRSERQAVVDSAQALASDFRVGRAQLVDMQVPVVNLADDTLREINRISEQIAGLNNGIRRQETSEREASDLRDARDRLLDELAQKAGTRVVEHKDGTVTVSLLSGPAIVTSDQFNQLGSQVVGGTLRLTLSDDDGSPTLLLNENSTGGELEGVLTSYNTDLGGAIQSLDELAFGLVRGVNALHTTGFGLDGNNGRDFFNITGPVNGAAASIELNPVIDADPNLIAATVNAGALPGGSDLAVELGNLRKVGLADLGGASVEEFLSEFQVDIGDKIHGTEQGLMDSESQDLTFSSIRESTRGVNLDEELTDLVSFQRGFQAAGRVVQAADEMMETVLGLI